MQLFGMINWTLTYKRLSHISFYYLISHTWHQLPYAAKSSFTILHNFVRISEALDWLVAIVVTASKAFIFLAFSSTYTFLYICNLCIKELVAASSPGAPPYYMMVRVALWDRCTAAGFASFLRRPALPVCPR